jgi:nucleoside 2-deoxyribosyltransferase
MRIFIAGIVQGSYQDLIIHNQDYRDAIKAILRTHIPDADLVCLMDLHPNSVNYGPELAQRTMFELIEEAERADVVIAYLPEASMGTALEIWAAYERGIPIISISPMVENWVVKFLSTWLFPTIEDFASFLTNGGAMEIERRVRGE